MASESPKKRTIRLKENLLSSSYELCIERAVFFTEIYKNNENLTETIKKAKAIAHTLKNMTIFIRDDEMLVGHETGKNLGEKLALELYSYKSFTDKDILKQLGMRKSQPFYISDSDIERLTKIIPFWKGKSLFNDIIFQRMQDEKVLLRDDNTSATVPNIAVMTGTNEGHICMGYEKLLKLGYKGIIKEAEYYQKRLDIDNPEYDEIYAFYDAVKIYYQSAIEFALRYSILAQEMAKKDVNLKRREELKTVSECMRNISKNKAVYWKNLLP